MPAFDNLFNKAKDFAKDASDKANKAAKIAKLKVNVKTLEMEKARHLQTIGQRTYLIWTETKSIDGKALYERIKDELNQIERAENRIKEHEVEIEEIHASHVDVTDVTEEDAGSSSHSED